MPFHTVCPFCPTKFKFPDNSLGASIRCPKCGNNFTAAPQDEEALACVGFYRANVRQFNSTGELQTRTPPTMAEDKPREEPVEQVSGRATILVAPPVPARPVLVPNSTPRDRSIGEWGLVALLVAGMSVLAICLVALAPWSAFLRYLAISFAAIGLLTCGGGLWLSAGDRKLNDLVSLGLGATVSVIVLLAAMLRSTPSNRQEVLRQLLEEADPGRFLLVTADNRQTIKDLGRSEWADAEKESLRQDEVHVRVLWAKIDSPPLKKTAPPATLPKCLLIMVQIANLSPQQAKEYKGLAHASPAPLLTDRRNHSYAPCKFPVEAGVVDLVERTVSPTGQRVQELLIFEAPDHEIDLKLQFSATAWGGRGACRFQILRTMFTGSLPR
jgi:predicted Zn finger-like uncharacterized protein